MNKVRVGFFSFTEVTDPGEHHAYNRWHQLDHVPENRALPGIAHGQRWVRTHACRERHRPSAEPALDRIHYVTLYLMTAPVERTLDEFRNLGARLAAIGPRFHRFRESHMNGPFLFVQARVHPRVLVAPEALPYRPQRGVYVSCFDVPDPAEYDAVTEWLDRTRFPDALEVPGVAGVWSFVSSPPRGPGPSRPDPQADPYALPPGRVVNVYYLDEPPLQVADELRARSAEWDAAGRGLDPEIRLRRLVTGPFETIDPWNWDWFEDA